LNLTQTRAGGIDFGAVHARTAHESGVHVAAEATSVSSVQ